MGGGGAMRAAAKVAGISVFNGGLRAEHPVTAAARKVARPLSSSISSEDIKLVASVHDDKSDSSTVVQQSPYWEIDDWEFAGGEHVFPVEPVEKMPRLVFGGAPTLDEAKVATSELKDALEKTYLSPSASNNGLAGSFVFSEGSSRESEFALSDSEQIENKPLIASKTAVTTLAPKHALLAFKFLNESPAAQTVVASIASDPNVWGAVLQNEALVEYINSQKANGAFSSIDATMNEAVADSDPDSPEYVDESYDSSEPGSGNVIMDYFENIRVKVVDMMNSLSDTIINLFGDPVGDQSSAHTHDGKTTFADKAIGASFMGLAVMVIMVVALKRA